MSPQTIYFEIPAKIFENRQEMPQPIGYLASNRVLTSLKPLNKPAFLPHIGTVPKAKPKIKPHKIAYLYHQPKNFENASPHLRGIHEHRPRIRGSFLWGWTGGESLVVFQIVLPIVLFLYFPLLKFQAILFRHTLLF